MKYRPLIKNESEVSVFGLGTMRFITKGSKSLIDEFTAKQIVLRAIEEGVNYIDTGYTYHNGQCEEFIGRIVTKQYRKYVDIVTKMPLWIIESHTDMDKIFREQMKRLRTTYFKYYMFHALNRQTWEKMKKLDVLEWIEKKKREGDIGHIGFSFHDDYDSFVDILNGYEWEFCQIQYNYLQENYQAGTKGLKYAAAKGIGIVIMEPLLGGILANPPKSIMRIIDNANPNRTPAELALRWVWDKTEVSVALSGMNSLDHVLENTRIASGSAAGSFTEEDCRLINMVRNSFMVLKMVPCTGCRYCMPCPHGVDIVRNLELYNLLQCSTERVDVKKIYQEINKSCRADACTKCGICLEVCPQKIDIIHWLHATNKEFDNNGYTF